MDTQRVEQKKRACKGKCRTTVGRLMALRAAYFGGRLDEEASRRYEDLSLAVWRLYREVSQ